MSSDAPLPTDAAALIRSRRYRVMLVFAALVGLIVSVAAWGFLELVHAIQVGVFEDLPGDLGYDNAPIWWPLPWVALAGLLTAFAIAHLPGRGGHVPANGLKTGGAPTQPIELPGVLLAAVATLGLGLVLGPEAPLIALGMGLGILAMRQLKKDAPDQAVALMAAAGSFAAVSAIFGSPIIGAVIIIEAAGLSGAMLPVVLLPGLLAAGIGSLVFIGLGSWSGFSTDAWALSPFPLPSYGGPSWGDFGWSILLAVAAATATFVILEIARVTKRVVEQRLIHFTVAAGLVCRRARDRLRRGNRRADDSGPVLRSGCLLEALQLGANSLPLDTCTPAALQRAGLEHLPRQLQRRPHIPGPVPWRRRRSPSSASTGLRRDTGRCRTGSRRLRLGSPTPAVIGHDRVPALRQGRARGDAARRCRSGRGLPRNGSSDCLRGFAGGAAGCRHVCHRKPAPATL